MAWLTIRQSGVRILLYGVPRALVRNGDVSFELFETSKVHTGRKVPDDFSATAPKGAIYIEVRDITMARRHFEIHFIAGIAATFVLEDLSSLGGTFVNSDRVIGHRKRVLRDGDTIHLGAPNGGAKIIFNDDEPSDAPLSSIMR